MTAMKQALSSARPRGGTIDEGNMIYLFDLGINAAQAQAEVFAYLQWENNIISEGKAPTQFDNVINNIQTNHILKKMLLFYLQSYAF